MKYPKDFGYMSLIQTVSDVNNAFLSRRELTCDFAGLGGKLKTMEAVDNGHKGIQIRWKSCNFNETKNTCWNVKSNRDFLCL